MKIPQGPVAQKKEDDGGAKEGKTMSPPDFQLNASPAETPALPPPPVGPAKLDDSGGAGDAGGAEDKKSSPDGLNAPVRPPQSQELERCFEERQVIVGDDWEHFAVIFNKEFASILHIFKTKTCGTDNASAVQGAGGKYVGVGKASGTEVSASELSKLFTTGQRDKIIEFSKTNLIPERLFNGDDVGNTSAQQRILMSGHILAKGKYKPGSYEQGVHARMCWHWVHITHSYAGATAGRLNRGMMGTADHNNDIVITSGSYKSKFHGKKDDPSNIAPGTKHKEAYDKAQAREEADPSKPNKWKMLKTMPFADFSKIEPGDWIWYYNANGSGVGSHSVIFSRWASDVLTDPAGVKYRKAICFSQGQTTKGGREHTANLGERYSKTDGMKVSPINFVTSVSADANPADTVKELLNQGNTKREAKLVTGNEKYITRTVERRLKSPVDRSKVIKKLQGMSKPLIDGLGDRITDGQRAMLEEANASKDITTLVKLYQRLKHISATSNILESNQEKLNESTDAKHVEVSGQVAAAEAKIDAEVKRLILEKADLEDQKAGLEIKLNEGIDLKDELDTRPEVRAKRAAWRKLHYKIKAIVHRNKRKNPEFLETDLAFLQMKAEKEELTVEIAELRAEGVKNKKALDATAREIRKLKGLIKKKGTAIKRNGTLQKRQEAKRTKAKQALPYSMVHGGRWKGKDNTKMSGKLKDVFKLSDFKEMLVDKKDESDGPKPE